MVFPAERLKLKKNLSKFVVGGSKTVYFYQSGSTYEISYLKTEYANGLFVTVKILRMVFAHVIYTCMKPIIFYTAISAFQ